MAFQRVQGNSSGVAGKRQEPAEATPPAPPAASPQPIQNVDEEDDTLELESLFEARLREATESGVLVFSDVRKAPRSCRVVGTYSTQKSQLRLELKLRYEKKEVHKTTLTGSTDNIPLLLQQISDAVIQHCPVQ